MAFYPELNAGSDAIVTAIKDGKAASAAFETTTLAVGFGTGKVNAHDASAAGITDTTKNYDFYFVVFNDADATKATEYAMVSDLNKAYSGMDAKYKASGVFSSTTAWQTTAVPEPTSGLLMLLGIAGLALRRRRA